MTPQMRRSFAAPHRAYAASASFSGLASVTVSPSKAQIRRAEPSLSFQVVAPCARRFDVIVATDPLLFDPANAHRRTPRNFRTSRQDFQGEGIEIETGFYLLPRAFIRELVLADPRPTRLYYVAAAYADDAATTATYSIAPEAMTASAPSVGIADDLIAANLSKVLGMAVDRLGAVNASGRVMSVQSAPSALPDAIGGLPIFRRTQPGYASPAPSVQTPKPAIAPRVEAAPAPRPALVRNSAPGPAFAAVEPQQPSARPDTTYNATSEKGFVDEDYTYGRSDLTTSSSFRDLDRNASYAPVSYDDGFGAPAGSFSEDVNTSQPIPALDPGPAAPPAPVPERPRAAPPIAPTGPAPDEDILLQAVIAEGAGGRYDALNLDGGFRGRLGNSDPYYQRAHDGLRIGPHQAMQDSGELGELLMLMQAADPTGFVQIFGPSAEAMLAVATAAGPSGFEVQGGRGPRVQPVAGRDLWEEPWLERFRSAARHPPFQAAMRGQILARRLDPLRAAAKALGIDTERGQAMLLALALQRGVEGALGHLRLAANPFDTPARLTAALDALGFSDLGSFRSASGLPPGDLVDDATHFALFAALREFGPQSPVQVPDGEAVMDAVVTAAGPGALGDALLKLRVSANFGNHQGGVS